MEIDFDLGAIVISAVSTVFCAGAMFSTVNYLKKTTEEIKKDFKGIGTKLGRIDSELTYLKGKLDGRTERDI